MVWDDKLPSIVERTGFDGSFHMVAQWFPKLAKIEPDGTFAHFPFHHLGEFYADYGNYDVTVDVPEAFLVGATGAVTESRVENGRRIERHVQDDIHDFAWTAWDKFQTRKETIDGVACTILYPPGYDDHAERELATIRFALPHYGARYGKYPYPLLTLVHPPASAPEAGGMEYPTLITTGGSSFIPNGVNLIELVTIHEFGHQYFYGLLASHETQWPFLDEGLNSYAEAEAMEAWRGKSSFIDLLGLSIGDAEGHAERARHYAHDDRVAQPAYAFGTGTSYGALVYSRTATILETLRRVYGDKAMQRTMGAYARRFRFQHPVPRDLIETFQREMGNEAGEVLRDALFDKGWIDFKVEAMSSHAVRVAAGIFDRDGKRETTRGGSGNARQVRGLGAGEPARNAAHPGRHRAPHRGGDQGHDPWDGSTDSLRIPYAGELGAARRGHRSRAARAARRELRERLRDCAGPRRRWGTENARARGVLVRARPGSDRTMMPLEPRAIHARKRPVAVASMFVAELAWAFVVATPVHEWVRRAWGAHPDGDAVLFAPGGRDLLVWLGQDDAGLSVTARTTLVLLVVGAVLLQLPFGALVASLAFGREAATTPLATRPAMRTSPPSPRLSHAHCA